MEDTFTWAKTLIEAEGPCEVEISYGREADLHQHLKACDKNPGHQEFVPVDQFNLDHLPPGCHDNDLVDLVRAVSDLTVRVSVKCVTEDRPEIVDGRLFQRYEDRGSNMMRMGAGWIWNVVRYTDENNLHIICTCENCMNSPTSKIRAYPEFLNSPTPKICTCPKCVNSPTPKICTCQECVNSPTPKTQFAHIHIQSATHVFCDDLETAHTTCHLFFDESDKTISGVVTLSDMSCALSDLQSDPFIIKYVTHDLDLADKLIGKIRYFNQLKNSFLQKTNSKFCKDQLSCRNQTLNIIVPNPDGRGKHVNVNYGTKNDLTGAMKSMYIEQPATCPGSSGAPVFLLGKEHQWFSDYTQDGNCDEDKEFEQTSQVFI